jgi:hypothetical protein
VIIVVEFNPIAAVFNLHDPGIAARNLLELPQTSYNEFPLFQNQLFYYLCSPILKLFN